MYASASDKEWIRYITGLLMAVGLLATTLHADEVRLRDGSKLVGTIQELTDGQLILSTSFADELSINAAEIQSIQTDKPLAVITKDRDRIVGTLQVVDGEQLIRDTSFGDLPIDLDNVRAMTLPDAPTPKVEDLTEQQQEQIEQIQAEHQEQVEATKAQHEQRAKELEQAAKQFKPEWSGRIELGFDGQTGNTESRNFSGAAEALRETADDRLSLFIEGRYEEDSGDKTTNEVIGGSRLEVDVTERLFTFGEVTAEFDEFENLDLRVIATAGLGYFFIQEDRQELKGRAGLGFQHESFMDGESESEFIASLGYDYRLDIHEKFRLTHSLTYFPTFEDPGSDFRVVVETAGEVPISEDEAWKLRAGMRNDYDNQPPDDIDRLDTSYFLNLVYTW